MQNAGKPQNGRKKLLLTGLMAGVFLTLVMVLASGFMVETTNTDQFCVSCHVMTPFRNAWAESKHGGQNARGFKAQCVDCHLPHGNFVEYLTTKAITGTSDVINNMIIDPYTYDWVGAAEANRLKFTYDSACRNCHSDLTPKGLSSGGRRAHNTYLMGRTTKKCADCHPHVGHEDMIGQINSYFKKK